MKKNVAGQSIGSQIIAAADGSDFTGTVTAYYTGDDGTRTIGSVSSGVCVHKGSGEHTYAPSQAETNFDHIVWSFTGTGAISVSLNVYTTFPQSADNPTAAAIRTEMDANSVQIGAGATLALSGIAFTTTGATDTISFGGSGSGNGFGFPRSGAGNPWDTNFATQMQALIISDTTPFLGASIAGMLADTDELQTNQGNWLTATGFSLASVCTEARLEELDAANLPATTDATQTVVAKFSFTVANQVDSNIKYVNDVTVTGTGASGDEWGPV